MCQNSASFVQTPRQTTTHVPSATRTTVLSSATALQLTCRLVFWTTMHVPIVLYFEIRNFFLKHVFNEIEALKISLDVVCSAQRHFTSSVLKKRCG